MHFQAGVVETLAALNQEKQADVYARAFEAALARQRLDVQQFVKNELVVPAI